MDHLKLRAWNWNRKRMIEVSSIDFLEDEIRGSWREGDSENSVVLPLSSCELLPFTGLCDMNGDEIYEGDIVDDTCGRIGIPQSTHVVKWNEKEAGFRLYDYRGTLLPWQPHLLRLVGNVYENRDLLDKY